MRGRIRQLWRSMPVRLALLLVLLFSTVSLISLLASYAVTRNSFETAIRADLEQDIAGFRAAPNSRAVALLVDAESRGTDPGRVILSYITPNGQIFGNGAIARDDEGYHIVSLAKSRTEYDGDYLSLTIRLYGGQLTVARSLAQIEALRVVFFNILLLSLLPTILIALSGGLYLARRSKRHVEVIGGTLDDLTNGDLTARVTMGPRWADDLVRIGDKVNQMAGAQEAQTQMLRQVSSDIAHDLKTPIQRVAVYLDDMARTVPSASDEGALLGKAQDEVAGIASVFQSLLQIASVESGSPKAHFKPVNLNQLCETMTEVYEPAAAAKGQSLVCAVPDKMVQVVGDKNLLGQVLANLVENAMRHTPEGSKITVTLAQNAGRAILEIADNGPGIPAAEREKVVRRLYRLDRSRNTPGNGLGLSLVEGVVKLHGGHLSLLDNAPGLRVRIEFQTDRSEAI
ncbi:HAMP domain-containing sensor histidine kinase [Sulfitobacter sp. HGT1]|uniref:sensor histidine kinase n=1 Tax=Sulfitobacter sp. HGT1 TaxID=2735435 RepID=UPI00159349D7|nr:HAMP domain-containing sensor histidine kinase [Sulfitobacter sp. HGT1]